MPATTAAAKNPRVSKPLAEAASARIILSFVAFGWVLSVGLLADPEEERGWRGEERRGEERKWEEKGRRSINIPLSRD